MISLTKLPPPITARSPRKSSRSAHMIPSPITDWRRVSLSFQRLWIKTADLFSGSHPTYRSAILPLIFEHAQLDTRCLVYQKHMEKQAHLPAEKRFVSCKALVVEKKIVEHASVAWLGIFLQCSLPN